MKIRIIKVKTKDDDSYTGKMMEFEEIKCPICNSINYEIVTHRGLFNIFLNESICKNCGCVYLNPRWTKEEYNKFYKNSYDKYFNRTNGKGEKIKYKPVVDRLFFYLVNKNKLNILDIGAGLGYGLKEFKKTYFDSTLYGIESSLFGQKKCRKNKIIVLSDSWDKNWDEINIRFDVIIMRGIFEHCLYPNILLSNINSKLKSDGFLYIALPLINYYNFSLTKPSFRCVHPFHFSEKNLSYMLNKNGFGFSYIKENDDYYYICYKDDKYKDIKLDFNEYSYFKDIICKENNVKGKIQTK